MLRTPIILCLIATTTAVAGTDERIDALCQQLDRLRVIEFEPEVKPQAEAMLDELTSLLDARPTDHKEIDRIYVRMDNVRTWLLAHAVERPMPVDGEFFETATHWGVRAEPLALTLAKDDFAMAVATPKGEWRWRSCDDKDIELIDGRSFSLLSARSIQAEAFHTGFSAGLRISLGEFEALPRVRLDILAHITGHAILFEIVPAGDISDLAFLAFPKSLITGPSETDVAVIPRMQGMLIPGNWPQEIAYRNLTNSRELYMPWWGQIADGRGVQTIFETPDDAGADYSHARGGPTRIQPLWYASLKQLRYPRRVRYVFDDKATYVSMAKRYRRFVQEKGEFVSLAEKRVRTPNLDMVIGKPVVHIGALYHTVEGSRFFHEDYMERNHRLQTFEALADSLRQLKKKGIRSAYVHLDGWGYYGYDNGHPDVLPPGPEQGGWKGLKLFADTCDSLGYLFAVHDQYRDYYLTAVSFDRDLAIRLADGTLFEHADWAGGTQTLLSPRFYPGYVRRNHDLFAEHGIKVRGAYLDVFAVVPLEESYQPTQPITRTDCARYRRECFDLLRARGYVVSSEEPTDYLVRSLDLVHHGPYPTQPKGYGPGKGTGIAVPLFNLVYHDSILLPWHMTDSGGWGIPDGDAGWLHCVLNAGLPYVSPGAGPEQIERVKEVSALAARLGLLEMTDHQFVDGARRVQRTTYNDGTKVTVNFDQKTYTVSPKPGKPTTRPR